MRVSIKVIDNVLDEEDIKVVELFIKFLQKQLRLSEDLKIICTGERVGKMTTGVRNPDNTIKVLCSNRMLIDVLRTLSHEWVHEYQDQELNILRNAKVQDIGGPEENMANVLSGIFIKKFQKLHPELEKKLYNE